MQGRQFEFVQELKQRFEAFPRDRALLRTPWPIVTGVVLRAQVPLRSRLFASTTAFELHEQWDDKRKDCDCNEGRGDRAGHKHG